MQARAVFIGWTALLITAVLWPLATPGVLLHRDMAVLSHPALSESALGFGDLPARNAPQDGVLALAGLVVDASWVARLLLVAAALLGAAGVHAVSRHCQATLVPTLLAITITLVNPFVVERLLQGHWSLVIAAWLLPGIAIWSWHGHWRLLLPALWLASLTPTGTIVAVVVALVAKYRHLTMGFGVVLCLPWLIPSILNSPAALPAGGSMFAARAEHLVGTVGAVLGLGGIWNAGATPPSREQGFALAGIALFFLLITAARGVPQRLLALGGVALLLTSVLAFLPSVAEFSVARIPGFAMFRDSHKLVMFAIPAFVFLAARLRPRSLAIIGLCLALIQVWDAPMAVDKLRPVPEPTIALPRDRDTFIPNLPTLAMINGTATVNPLFKAAPVVENGELRVDGTLVDAPSPRFRAAQQHYQEGDLAALRDLGIGAIYDGELTIIAQPHPRSAQWWLGFGLLLMWLSAGALALLAPWRRQHRSAPTKT